MQKTAMRSHTFPRTMRKVNGLFNICVTNKFWKGTVYHMNHMGYCLSRESGSHHIYSDVSYGSFLGYETGMLFNHSGPVRGMNMVTIPGLQQLETADL